MAFLRLCAKRSCAFNREDQHLLHGLAGNLGLSLRACRDRSYMTTIPAQADLKDLSAALVRYLPDLTGGTGCSIFMRLGQDPNSEAVLFASTELPNLVGSISYKPGEGLTGWVLKTGRTLAIPASDGARSPEKLSLIDPGLTWFGKYRDQDESGIDFMNRAFLAHPVLNPSGDVVGVVRIGSRWTGDFSPEDKEIVQHYANVLGSMVSKTKMADTLREIKDELRSLRSEILSGRESILTAIKLLATRLCDACLRSRIRGLCIINRALLLLNVTFIDFRVAFFGCLAFISYWLMGKISQMAHQRDGESGQRVLPNKLQGLRRALAEGHMMLQNIVYLFLSILGAVAFCGFAYVIHKHTVRHAPQFIAKVIKLEVQTQAGRFNLFVICLQFFLILLESACSLLARILAVAQGQPPGESPVLAMYICLSVTALGSLIIVAILENQVQ